MIGTDQQRKLTSDPPQVGLSTLQHINQSSRSSDNNFATSLEVPDLSTLWHSSVDTGVTDSGAGAELGALFLDLDSQFTGGGENSKDDSDVSPVLRGD